MIIPLVKNVLIASSGITVLESMAGSSSLDRIELLDGRICALQPGAFSHGSTFSNLRAILGPHWKWRLLCPVRGGITDFSHEPLTNEVVRSLRKLNNENK